MTERPAGAVHLREVRRGEDADGGPLEVQRDVVTVEGRGQRVPSGDRSSKSPSSEETMAASLWPERCGGPFSMT